MKQTGAKCRMCRRAGTKLFLKGERCYTTKCAIVRRNYPPGVSGAKNSKPRLTGYGIQLREKQKARRFYGLSEVQFSGYFAKANRKEGNTADGFIKLLEMRLDNVIYRLGWADSHAQARQFVSHGHVTIDGKKVTIPSYQVGVGQMLGLSEKGTNFTYFKELLPKLHKKEVPGWLANEPEKYSGKVVQEPKLEETSAVFDMKSIIEFYSR